MKIDKWHILPTNDLIIHKESSKCKCDPKIKTQSNGNILVIHNAYDGREIIEYFNKINNENNS